MAVVISVEKLAKGINEITTMGPVFVRLKDTSRSFKDKDTGWNIVGDQIKELPSVSPGFPSQALFMAVRSGRFVRVPTTSSGRMSKRKKYEELVESIIKEYDDMLTGLEP